MSMDHQLLLRTPPGRARNRIRESRGGYGTVRYTFTVKGSKGVLCEGQGHQLGLRDNMGTGKYFYAFLGNITYGSVLRIIHEQRKVEGGISGTSISAAATPADGYARSRNLTPLSRQSSVICGCFPHGINGFTARTGAVYGRLTTALYGCDYGPTRTVNGGAAGPYGTLQCQLLEVEGHGWKEYLRDVKGLLKDIGKCTKDVKCIQTKLQLSIEEDIQRKLLDDEIQRSREVLAVIRFGPRGSAALSCPGLWEAWLAHSVGEVHRSMIEPKLSEAAAGGAGRQGGRAAGGGAGGRRRAAGQAARRREAGQAAGAAGRWDRQPAR
ncbi:hypothetical protein GGX14DRAFT_404986 [Mycena pura]|uniref:Uncharacterized protein n=1 Tax=Mycena pura TaxID=153505 RepID=A0AAD6XZM6_9AGAR|nr:hypothetical protein GGX14DRAFT_404986 [Mycena pura]